MAKLKFWIGLVFGGIAFWFCLKGVSWAEVWATWRQINPLFVLCVGLLLLLAYVFRAIRWMALVEPQQSLSFSESFSMNAVGFLLIHILPFRLGEFARPYFLKSRYRISMTSGTAIVLVERVFDGLMCTLALFVGLISMSESTVNMEGWTFGLRSLAWTSFFVFIPVLVVMILFVLNSTFIVRAVTFLVSRLPLKIRTRILRSLGDFIGSLSMLPHGKKLLQILLHTFGVWAGMPLAYWMLFQAFGFHLPWEAAFSLMGIAALGVMVPGPPGFIGTFQLFVQAGLSIYGVSKSAGFAYAMLFYVINMTFVIGVGLLFFYQMSMSLNSMIQNLSESKEN